MSLIFYREFFTPLIELHFLIFLILVITTVPKVIKSDQPMVQVVKEVFSKTFTKWSVIIVYFALPTVAIGIFDAIRCRAFKLDDNLGLFESFLLVDMSITCTLQDEANIPNTGYRRIFTTFWILFVMWIILTPLAILYLLKKASQSIQSKRITSLADSCRFLWEDYSPNMWYWDIVDLYRKIFLTGLIMFIDTEEGSNKVVRLVIAAIVSVLYMGVLLAFHPYEQQGNNNFAFLTNFLLICCFILGIMLKLCAGDEGGGITEQVCSRFIGKNFNSINLSTLCVGLALGLLVISFGILSFLSYNRITAPSVKVVSTNQKPNLELPEDCTHHVFVSHIWSTGQAKTHAIARKLQLMVPGLQVWLDVDELNDISKLEQCVDQSAAFVRK